MKDLQDSLIELIRRASAEIPDDVHEAIVQSQKNEKKGTNLTNKFGIISEQINNEDDE